MDCTMKDSTLYAVMTTLIKGLTGDAGIPTVTTSKPLNNVSLLNQNAKASFPNKHPSSVSIIRIISK